MLLFGRWLRSVAQHLSTNSNGRANGPCYHMQEWRKLILGKCLLHVPAARCGYHSADAEESLHRIASDLIDEAVRNPIGTNQHVGVHIVNRLKRPLVIPETRLYASCARPSTRPPCASSNGRIVAASGDDRGRLPDLGGVARRQRSTFLATVPGRVCSTMIFAKIDASNNRVY
jgi:hypothetical protein